MINSRSTGTFTSAGVLSAIAASLCCITPVVALLAGSSSMVANFSWIAPARPYLIGLSIAVLAFAWYIKLTPAGKNDLDCNCATTRKSSFFQTKTFLGILTLFAFLMMAFPLYAKLFFPQPQAKELMVGVPDNRQQVKFTIRGMTCEGCEAEINNQLARIDGVLRYNTSYATKSTIVTFDKSRVDANTIEAAINKTGYTVTGRTIVNGN